jgi:predicted extracellular nuclease/ABC-type phosphate transport system substrate-binding protein
MIVYGLKIAFDSNYRIFTIVSVRKPCCVEARVKLTGESSMNLQRVIRSRASQLLAFSYLLTSCLAANAQTTSPIVINEFRRDGTLATTEYVELLLTQDLTAAQLESYFVGDSTSATAAKFGAYKFTNMASIAATFKAGTIIVIGGTTAIPSQDTSYNPIAGGSDDNWNIRLQVGGSFLTGNGSSGDFAAADVAWVDTSSAGTTSADSVAWPTSGLGAFGTAAKVKIAAPNNAANVEFTSDINGVDVASNYSINSLGSLGIPNVGANATYVNGLRGGVVLPTLTLSVAPSTFLETDGATAATATLTRSGSTSGALTVNLTSSDPTGATVPSTVTIPAAQASTTFAVAAVNDTVSSANKTVTITAQSSGFVNGTFAVTVTNVGVGTVRIRNIQGAAHISPLNGQTVTSVPGIVTAVRTNGFYFQDPTPDSDDATSEGVFVFTSTAPTVSVGQSVLVSGTISEFIPGGATSGNLSTTEITSPSISVLSSGNPLPAPIVIGNGGRIAPNQVIEDDATNVNTNGVFDPATDGIDFYESLEGMRVQVNNAVATKGTNSNGEIPVLPDNGANASLRSIRGGIVIRSTDFNPERVILDDGITASPPSVNVGDQFNAPIVGVLDYSFGNFKLLNTSALPTFTSANLAQEVTTLTSGTGKLTIASFNLENLDPSDTSDPNGNRFNRLASVIVNSLKSPDILGLQEIQDNNGATDNGTVDPSTTLNTLIAAIQAAGGPTYQFRQINPVNNQDGGEPGGNIRPVFLFNPTKVSFVDRAGGGSTTANTVVNNGGVPQLQFSPGRIDPNNTAFSASRKPLAGEFVFNNKTLFIVVNHFNSKGGDNPLFGNVQPPVLSSEAKRVQQAQIVNSFVTSLLSVDPNADVVVVGDLNDFEFSNPITTLKGTILSDLIDNVGQNDRYTFNFDGNGQVLDHILVSNHLFTASPQIDIVHANSDFAVQATDHDPPLARLSVGTQVTPAPSITSFTPTSGTAGTAVNITGSGFTAASSVQFNGAAALSYVVNSDTSITATVPSGAASGLISVVTPGGTATSSTSFTVIASSPPIISSFSPTSGGAGLVVIITGSGFIGTSAVQFNGTAATSFTVNSNTQITATVPSGGTTGQISVVAPGGTANSTSNFTVVVPAISQDPTITFAASASAPAAYGTISTSAVQYFANGATFPAIGLRNLLDFYGVAIPKTAFNIGQIGSQGTQPFNSPRVNFSQFNYCGTGEANGTATYTGTASVPLACAYVSAASGTPTVLGTPNQAPTPLPNPPAGAYALTTYPAFQTGVTSLTSSAPLFTFSTGGLSASDLATYASNKLASRGNPIQVPVLFGAIIPALNANINGGVSPNLTTTELCKVFDGQITNYNQIASTASLNLPIQVVVRSDSSSTTSVFTEYLANACSGSGVVTPGFVGYYITAATDLFPTSAGNPSTSFIRRTGDDGVSDYVATTSGGVGYVESAFAQPYSVNAPLTANTPAPIQAALQNPVSGSFLTATLSAVRNALANVGLSANTTYPCVLSVTGVPVVPTIGNAYPIVTQSYSLTYSKYATSADVNAVKGLFSFILGNRTTPIQANDQIAQQAGFILLSKGTANNTINPLRSQARACINSAVVGP